MVSEEIIFAPNIDERMLGKETRKVNRELEDAGNITPEIGDVDGGGFGLGELSGGGGGGMGGGAAGGAALASRIPKPIAGVTASAAMPVALAGGIGVGLLSAMHGASARLQTSTSLMGQAWNNVWRPLGDRLDELFIRDIAKDLVSETQNFEEAFRSGNWLAGLELASGIDFSEDSLAQKIGGAVGLAFGGPLTSRVLSGIADDIANSWTWTMVEEGISESWPGWPDISLPNNLWPDVRVPNDLWPDSSDILGRFPSLSVSSLRNRILGNGPGGGGGGGGGSDGLPDWLRGFDGSGATSLDTNPTSPGVGGAGPQERSGGDTGGSAGTTRTGGGGSTDTQPIEDGLDRVERAVRDMNREFANFDLSVDGETFGRLTTETRHDETFDTDALL